MIHGMVDRPLIFTMDELKRLPYVTRVHFLECIGNRSKPTHKPYRDPRDDQLQRMDRRPPLRTAQGGRRAKRCVLDCCRRGGEIKGASSIPLGKAMDDCLVCYGQNGEPYVLSKVSRCG